MKLRVVRKYWVLSREERIQTCFQGRIIHCCLVWVTAVTHGLAQSFRTFPCPVLSHKNKKIVQLYVVLSSISIGVQQCNVPLFTMVFCSYPPSPSLCMDFLNLLRNHIYPHVMSAKIVFNDGPADVSWFQAFLKGMRAEKKMKRSERARLGHQNTFGESGTRKRRRAGIGKVEKLMNQQQDLQSWTTFKKNKKKMRNVRMLVVGHEKFSSHTWWTLCKICIDLWKTYTTCIIESNCAWNCHSFESP